MNRDDLRKCVVYKKDGEINAFFHKWVTVAQVRDAIMIGTISGQLIGEFALVEYEDGKIERVDVEKIRFIS